METEQLWKQCMDWLIRCEVLPFAFGSSITDVINFANRLRDGVLLCRLLKKFLPQSMSSPADISIYSRNSQFLAMKNIEIFLRVCEKTLKMKSSDIFTAKMLYDFQDFNRVLNTLSVFSKRMEGITPKLLGFPASKSPQESAKELVIYQSLEAVAQETQAIKCDDINSITVDASIYETIVECKNAKRRVQPEPTIEELVVTERNYVNHLRGIEENFMNPLLSALAKDVHHLIFGHVNEMIKLHEGLCQELEECTNPISTKKISEAFNSRKRQFLIYAQYCSDYVNISETITGLINNDAKIKRIVSKGLEITGNKAFQFSSILHVPVQRVMKYHLFLEEIKNTSTTSSDRTRSLALLKAKDDMLDVIEYVNEYKREKELIETMAEIEKNLKNVLMPEGFSFRDYGKLLFEGEIRIQTIRVVSKYQMKGKYYALLFQTVLILCEVSKVQTEKEYSFVAALKLSVCKVSDVDIPNKYKWFLNDEEHQNEYVMSTKTKSKKDKWLTALRKAIGDLITLPNSVSTHKLTINTFSQAVECNLCDQLLLGLMFQGYKCNDCNLIVHGKCLEQHSSLLQTCAASNPQSTSVDPLPEVKELRRFMSSALSSDVIQELSSVVHRDKSFSGNKKEKRKTVQGHVNTKASNVLQCECVNATSGENIYAEIEDPLHRRFWDAGSMERGAASKIMKSLPHGSFLVRKSTREENSFAITLKLNEDVRHFKVMNHGEMFFFGANTTQFENIEQLVHWYSKHSLKEVFKSVDITLDTPYKTAIKENEGVTEYVEVIYDYSSSVPETVSVTSGAVIEVLDRSQESNGWLYVRSKGVEGYVPAKYVQSV